MALNSLNQTATANKVDPYWYLRPLFEQLPIFDPADGDWQPLHRGPAGAVVHRNCAGPQIGRNEI